MRITLCCEPKGNLLVDSREGTAEDEYTAIAVELEVLTVAPMLVSPESIPPSRGFSNSNLGEKLGSSLQVRVSLSISSINTRTTLLGSSFCRSETMNHSAERFLPLQPSPVNVLASMVYSGIPRVLAIILIVCVFPDAVGAASSMEES